MKVKLIFLLRTLYFYIYIIIAYAKTNTMSYDMIPFRAKNVKK